MVSPPVIVGWKPCPEEKGIKTVPSRRDGTDNFVGNLALKKKGLRPSATTT